MKGVFSLMAEFVASNGAAVTVAVLITAALVFLVMSGLAVHVALRLEEKLSG
jgi:hypothetical protein